MSKKPTTINRQLVKTCNCGETTHLIFKPLHGEPSYYPVNKKWKFRYIDPHGWYCGREGHYEVK